MLMHSSRKRSVVPSKMQFIVILLISALKGGLSSVAFAEEVGHHDCHLSTSVSGVKADCSYLSLPGIPTDLPRETTTLDASFNEMKVLHNSSFTGLCQLIVLTVVRNHIYHLEVGTFTPLTHLQFLDLTGNSLAHLPDNIFESKQFLTTVVLSRNNLSSVPTRALHSLQLRNIRLDYNFIKKADFAAFSHTNNRANISLKGNSISSLQPTDFEPLRNVSLHTLDLSSNQLRNISKLIFSYLNNVYHLINLNSNKLREFNLDTFLGNVTVGTLLLADCGINLIIPLKNYSFINVTFPKIYQVILRDNKIREIPSSAFWGMSETRKLNIGSNKISKVNNESFCGLDSLTNLYISYNRIKYLPTQMFSCNPELQILLIAHNSIYKLNPMSFSGLLALRQLDISINGAEVLGTKWNNPALRILDISGNEITHLSDTKFEGNLSSLQKLKLSGNNLDKLSPTTFQDVQLLQEIYLESQHGGKLHLNGVFSKMKSLIKLDLSQTNITLTSTCQFNETMNLEELDLSFTTLNSSNIYDSERQSSLFDGLVSLSKLHLQGNNLNHLEPETFKSLSKLSLMDMSKAGIVVIKPGLFHRLISLKRLNLDSNNINKISENVLSGLNYLESLYFDDNRIEVIEKDSFKMTPNLHYLSLSGNRLTKVEKDMFFPTNRTLYLDIHDNPFSCTCDLNWFISRLGESNIYLKNPDQTVCYSMSIDRFVGILSFDPKLCAINFELMIIPLSFSGILVGFLIILAYINRNQVKDKLSPLKLAIIDYLQVVESLDADNHTFHLNLMFHESQEEWVDQILKPAIEERLPHLQNIVYGDKDLCPGMFYVNAIQHAIENSFKTVLLVSNSSVDDVWIRTKLRMALEHVNDTGFDKVILIFLEDIEEDQLPYLARLFVRRNRPHIFWTEDVDGQELFWATFERSMRVNKAINSSIPF
ncbi:toll-like receptor 13 [Lytechinus pictus]|uniref:toll-like receptor 13 n=1 Tax=Lytechinus pictus TaxID=7653 RepID=UPI0030BA1D86